MTALETWKELAETTKLGWPEWEDKMRANCRRIRALRCDATEGFYVAWFAGKERDFYWHHGISDHEAECLFENHARRWLARRGIWVQKSRCVETNLYVHRDVGDGPGEALCTDGKIRECRDAKEILAFGDDYTAALQAGVRAVQKEGKESPCKR